MRWAWTLALLALLLGAPARAWADVAVLTMTPGPAVVERFGHTALRVGDRVYNFGTFAGDDPELLGKFLERRVEYWLSVRSVADHYAAYENRVTTEQVLDLTPLEERELRRRLDDNARPDKRAYRYDFFLDNCATRVRDAVDGMTGGAVARAGVAAGRSTYRQLVEGVLEGPPLLGAAVSLLLNASNDVPLTRWEEAFLPRELERLLDGAVREDGRPLVRKTLLHEGPLSSGVAPTGGVARRAPGRLVDALLLFAVVMPAPLSLLAATDRGRRRLLGAGLASVGLVGGLLGVAVLVASRTPYPCARNNASLALLHPALLAFAAVGAAVLRGQGARNLLPRLGRLLAAVGTVAAVLDLVAHALGYAHQQHLGLTVLALAWNAAVLQGDMLKKLNYRAADS